MSNNRKLSRQHRLEAMLVRALLQGLRSLSPQHASNIGGFVTRLVGPWLPPSRVALRNLTLTMPHLGAQAHRRIVAGAWENLGRTVAELPHLADLPHESAFGPGWRMEGAEHLEAVAANGGPVLFVSGHLGNWEILPLVCAQYGLAVAPFYRAADNPAVDAIITDLRRKITGMNTPFFPKGAKGARRAMAHIAHGGKLGILADQKMNDGVEARLFGLPAMTAGATAAFAVRYQAPIVFGHVRREGAARFTVSVRCVMRASKAENRQAEILFLTQKINDELEKTISDYPESWLWMHKRFPKYFYKTQKP